MDITIPPGETVTVHLPGATVLRIDAAHRVIAVDGTNWGGEGEDGPLGPGWLVEDLRGGTYGGFHQLRPAGECIDKDCVESGQHATMEDRAAFRDDLAAP